ncbi:hypothetical protein VITU102760_16295 [Vibrio tubiashii]
MYLLYCQIYLQIKMGTVPLIERDHSIILNHFENNGLD